MTRLRMLHTADWHAGRTLHGRDRTPDVRAALERLVGEAVAADVGVVVVAGDLFDGPTPSAAAEEVVYGTLHALATEGIPVVVIAGNHDSPDRLEALAPALSLGRVFVFGRARTAGQGGVATVATPQGDLHVAALPFVSHRRLVKSAHLLGLDEPGQRMVYQDGMRTLVRNLTNALPAAGSGPRVLVMHGTMNGARLSSEYVFHSHEAYALPVGVIPGPEQVDYVALGHIHVPQGVEGLYDWRARYPGSLIQLDFGDSGQERGALIVDFKEGGEVERVTPLVIPCDRPLVTEEVPVEGLDAWARARTAGSAWVRLRVTATAPKPGIKERILREHADVIAVDLLLPEHERPEAARVDLERMDLERAFHAYHLDQRGRDPSPELAAAFKRVDDAITPEESA